MKYLEQRARMLRLYRKINPESGDHGDQTEYEDNLWFFFQSAWHLKDWIKNDPEVNCLSISKVALNYKSLRICSDLANRSKHLELSESSNKEDGKLVGNDVTISLNMATITINETFSGTIPVIKTYSSKYNYRIMDNMGKECSALDLAGQIIKDWDEIIALYVEPKQKDHVE